MNLDRRTLLIGGGAGVGLVVAFALWPRHMHSDLATRKGEEAFGNYLKVGRDGRVTVAVPQVETGQGIWTGLAQIVADELGAAWETVAVEPAPLTGAYGNALAGNEGWLDGVGMMRRQRIENDGRMRITAGSTSVRAFEGPLREAAAVARAMLVGAAADRWNVDPEECETGDGFVMNRGRTFTFGELAEEAAERNPPGNPGPRKGARGRLIGKPLPRLDGPSKADGSWRFAADVRLPGMLFASVRAAPPGGKLIGYSREEVEKLGGARQLVAREEWIAVVAENWWAAERALHAAGPVFSGTRTRAEIRGTFERALGGGGAGRSFRRGDYVSAVEGSRPLTATYFIAPSQHLGVEPLTATARFDGSRLEVWAPTQAPALARTAAAEAAGLGEGHVTLYPMPVGGPAGRALEADAIPFAVELARRAKAPVQVILSQSASQNHDLLSAGALARMTALPGAGGITTAWKMQVATVSGMGAAMARLLEIDDSGRAIRNAVTGLPPYGIPNVTVEAVRPLLPYRAGYMRGSPEREFAFFTESFIDELAHAAGVEPLAFRMPMLGQNGRLARCLQGAARLAQWDGGGRGSTMGIAGWSAFGSHIGLVAQASIGGDQRVKVERLVAAVDCGRPVNSGLVAQQIEAGLVWALAQSTLAAPEWVGGMPRARPLGAIGLPRLADIPQIVVEVIPSSAAPGGVSGLGTTVLAPAVANAIFAAADKRMRSLPFDPMSAG
ncbi:MAG TPA: molybdopterin cofactor-binding domain-containing protein [Sphingomicrobium sp.]|nr:molybdopterin cofactor-binding domain-containing protein [Sphingomicrobium sp.]